MARRGLATALQAALAGFGGYGQGVVAQRERAQKLTQAEEERKRREMLDILDLQERTYMRPEQLVQAREKAAAPTSRVVQSAILSALSPTRPAPLPSTEDIADVMATSALRQPLSSEQRITAYGQEYVRPEAPMVTERREKAMERAQRTYETAEDRRTRAAEQQANADLQRELTRMRIDADKQVANMRMQQMSNRPMQRPTEGQEKSYAFARIMPEANRVIEQFGPKARLGRVTAVLAQSNPLVIAGLNKTLTPEEQQLVTAIRQFAEPILRKNTGAAFGKEEIRWVEQQVVPLLNDSKEAQEYKSRSRSLWIETMQNLALPATMYYQSMGVSPVSNANITRATSMDAGLNIGASTSNFDMLERMAGGR